MSPPENEVDGDVVTILLPSEYNSNDESDDEEEDTYMSTQQRQRVIHPEAMLPTARNAHNLCPQKQPEFAKENIDCSM